MTIDLELLGVVGGRKFTLVCAQRVQPVVDHFAVAATKATYSEVLSALWGFVESESVLSEQVALLMARLEACPEADVDDWHHRGYYAMEALGVLHDAIRVVDAGTLSSVVEIAQSARDGALNLAGDIASAAAGYSSPLAHEAGEASEDRFLDLVAEAILRGDTSEAHLRQRATDVPWSHEAFRAIDLARGWVRRANPL